MEILNLIESEKRLERLTKTFASPKVYRYVLIRFLYDAANPS